jgi:hypothetical protein
MSPDAGLLLATAALRDPPQPQAPNVSILMDQPLMCASWRSRAKGQDSSVSTGDAGNHGNPKISKEHRDINCKTPLLKTGMIPLEGDHLMSRSVKSLQSLCMDLWGSLVGYGGSLRRYKQYRRLPRRILCIYLKTRTSLRSHC